MSTSMRIKKETKKKIIHARGILEYKDGERHSMDDTLNEVLDFFISQMRHTRLLSLRYKK